MFTQSQGVEKHSGSPVIIILFLPGLLSHYIYLLQLLKCLLNDEKKKKRSKLRQKVKVSEKNNNIQGTPNKVQSAHASKIKSILFA